MMTKEQQDTVTKVYRRFYESDSHDDAWTDVDEQMSMLEWLENPQLVIEAAVMHQLHGNRNMGCKHDHPTHDCFVPTIIDAVGYILDLYSETGNLHVNNRFILQYYLALTQVGFIVSK